MCLDTIDEKTKKGSGVGYKRFGIDDSYHLRFPYQGGRPKLETWIGDKNSWDIIACDSNKYRTGFHIYRYLLEAKSKRLPAEKILKVKFKDVSASGTQGRQRIIVARKIYIMKGEVK